MGKRLMVLCCVMVQNWTNLPGYLFSVEKRYLQNYFFGNMEEKSSVLEYYGYQWCGVHGGRGCHGRERVMVGIKNLELGWVDVFQEMRDQKHMIFQGLKMNIDKFTKTKNIFNLIIKTHVHRNMLTTQRVSLGMQQ